MSSRPWMPLYVDAYLLDTRDLSAEQHGIYMILLMLAWRQPDGTLPNDQKWIRANLPTMHGLTFNRLVSPLIERFFILNEAGRWVNRRLEKEWRKAGEISEKQSRNAKERWSAISKNNKLADAMAMPLHLQLQKKERTAPNGAAEATEKEPDVRTRLFTTGLRLLAEITGRTPDSCRSLIGRWLKLTADEALHVLAAIEDAHRNRVADPTAWITATLQGRSGNGSIQKGGQRVSPILAALSEHRARFQREEDEERRLRENSPRLLSNG